MHRRTTKDLDAARRIGTLEAYRLRIKLGLAPTERVDVFGLIAKAGIWLRFAPLQRLYGAYQRSGGTAGILLHAAHPLHLQRLTAAHEYGHHVLNHHLSIDEESGIDGMPSDDLREQEAFAFAGSLMIPLDGVHAKLPKSWRPSQNWLASPEDVYRMSAEFGVSYRAVVIQLAALKVITWRQAETLKKVSPLEIKRTFGSGWDPVDHRATVWRFDLSNSGTLARVDLGDEIHLYLPVAADLKVRWQPEDERAGSLETISDDLLSTRMILAVDRQHIVLRAIGAGLATISYIHQGMGHEAKTFSLDVDVLPDERPEGEGLYLLQQKFLLATTRGRT